MSLSKRAIETLIDLAENKLSDIRPFDRDDLRDIRELKACIHELTAMRGALSGAHGSGAGARALTEGAPGACGPRP